MRGTNALLPAGAAVTWMREVPSEFHARYSALERCYRYVLLNHPVRPALNQGRIGWFHAPLDLERMREAARISSASTISARSAHPNARPVRRCAISRRLEVRASGDYVVFDLAANAFLHHMVRNIVGCA